MSRDPVCCCSFIFLWKPLRSTNFTLNQSLGAAQTPYLPLVGSECSRKQRGSGQWGFPSSAGALSRRAGNLECKLVGWWWQPLLELCPCFPSKHLGTWTSWGWGQNTHGAWRVNSSESLASCQARSACCVQEVLNILSLKEGTWNNSKITLNTSTGSYREGGLGETEKITLTGPGEHTASADTGNK